MALLRMPKVAAALAHRDFRYFWAGSSMSVAGRQASMVVQAWLLYEITGSALQLGLLGFVRAVPAFILGLAGGVVADRIDRRKLMIATTVGAAIVWGVLAALTLTDVVRVWHILGISFLAGAVGAFEGPSKQSMFPHLIDRKDLTNAVALNSSIDPSVRIFVPIMAGVLIDRVGGGFTGPAAALFFVTGLYVLASLLLFKVRMPRVERSTVGGLQALGEGFAYLRTNHLMRFLLQMAFVNSIFGMAYTALLPVFAADISEGSSGSTLGLLFAAGGVGGFVGAIATGAARTSGRQGRIIVLTSTVFGSSLIAFSFIPWFGVALGLLFLASMANNVFAVVVQSMLHGRVPDEYRGRVMGFWGMQFTVMHPLGNLQIGVLATLVGASMAVAVGGVVVVAFAILVAGTNRGLRELGRPASSASR